MFDTGSAIVYALTDLCEKCNEFPKYNLHKTKEGKPMVSRASGFLNQEESVSDKTPRFEYGYGSGYINGYMSSEKICFADNANAAPCIDQTQVIMADFASGV